MPPSPIRSRGTAARRNSALPWPRWAVTVEVSMAGSVRPGHLPVDCEECEWASVQRSRTAVVEVFHEQPRAVDGVEFVGLSAEVAGNLHRFTFLKQAFDFFAAKHAQHVGNARARAG